jgi:uncharacterized membrane protein
MISPNPPVKEAKPSLRYRIKDEFVQASLLALYFAAWFCAIAFFSFALLREEAIPISPFGLAIIKAGLCAKFMMIGKAIFPLRMDANRGIVKSLFWHSLAYLSVVITLSIIEAGIDGLFHGKSFLESVSSFGHGDPIYIAALSIMYWLIIWPYLIVLGLNQSLGDKTVHTILFGSKAR